MNPRVSITILAGVVLLLCICTVESLFNPGAKIKKGPTRGYPTGGGRGKPFEFKKTVFGTGSFDRFKSQKRFKFEQDKAAPFQQLSKFGFAGRGKGRGTGRGKKRGKTGGRSWGERLKNAANKAQELKKMLEEMCVRKQIKMTQTLVNMYRRQARQKGLTLQTIIKQNTPAIARQSQGGRQIIAAIKNNVSGEKVAELMQLAYDTMTKCLITDYAKSALKSAVVNKVTKSKEEKKPTEDPLLD